MMRQILFVKYLPALAFAAISTLMVIPSYAQNASFPALGSPLPPVSPAAPTKTVLALSALFGEGTPAIEKGLHWRVFADQADVSGNYALVAETTEARPLLTLDPGGYIIHVAYGLSGVTRHVVLGSTASSERIVLNTGAVRLTAVSGEKPITSDELKFELHREDNGVEEAVAGDIKAGQTIRLPAGTYQVTSTFGSANAQIISEIAVQPGKLTEATIHHKAARVFLQMRAESTKQVINEASWSILTPGGDTVSDPMSGSPAVILAAGDYIAVARYNGKIYQQNFTVDAGKDSHVEVTIQ